MTERSSRKPITISPTWELLPGSFQTRSSLKAHQRTTEPQWARERVNLPWRQWNFQGNLPRTYNLMMCWIRRSLESSVMKRQRSSEHFVQNHQRPVKCKQTPTFCQKPPEVHLQEVAHLRNNFQLQQLDILTTGGPTARGSAKAIGAQIDTEIWSRSESSRRLRTALGDRCTEWFYRHHLTYPATALLQTIYHCAHVDMGRCY